MTSSGPFGWRDGEALLDRDDADRWQALHSEQDRRRHAASRAALRGLLARRWGITATVIHQRGRPPELPGGGLFLSLAHAGEWVLCAASEAPIGVDVESALLPLSARAGLERALNRAERTAVRLSRRPHHTATRMWVRKEAVLKAGGRPDLRRLPEVPGLLPLVREGRRLFRVVDIPVPGYAAAAATALDSRTCVEIIGTP